MNLITSILIISSMPLILIIFGILMYKVAWKRKNYVWGYRTTFSLKNENTFKFANMYCGKLWIILGIILTVLSLIVVIVISALSLDPTQTESVYMVVVIIQTISMILTFIPTEIALRKKYNANGIER